MLKTRLTPVLLFSPILWLPLTAGAQDGEVRELPTFDSIVVGGGVDLHIEQAAAQLVEVIAAPSDLHRIVTEVDGGTLTIRRESGVLDWLHGYAVNISLPELKAINASGGSDIRSEGVISGDTLSLAASGSSDVMLDLELRSLAVRASGGSDLILMGTVESLRVENSGGSDLDARRLTAREAEITMSGGSDALLTVLDRIVGSMSGGSDLIYSGMPAAVDVDTSGGSDIRGRDDLTLTDRLRNLWEH